MPRFEPPTQPQGMDDYFWGRYSIPVGQSVVRYQGQFVVMPVPWIGHLTNLIEGQDYFLGGHIYDVDAAIAGELTAAGFVVTDPDPDPEPIDSPAYGRGIYGVGLYGS